MTIDGIPESQEPYGSAHDLPSFQEMSEQLKGMKALTLLFSRDQHQTVRKLQAELDRTTRIVDTFYNQLGDRHWIFPEYLNLEVIDTLLLAGEPSEVVEASLVDLYRDRDLIDRLVRQAGAQSQMQPRQHLLRRARDHYFHDEFNSCALVLVTAMDGFINDFDAADRRGLHARDAHEMVAWDSVVGHHLGLTHVLQSTFLKTIKKRRDEEVFELYRHGVVHGSIVNYNNVVVATKAWNMLMAVIEWAKATKRSQEPREPAPQTPREALNLIKDSVKRYQQVQEDRAALDAWAPSSLAQDKADFATHPIQQRSVDFLTAWQHGNYGRLSKFGSRMWDADKSAGAWAGETRDRFADYRLSTFEIDRLDNTAAAVWEAHGHGVVNDEPVALTLRWILQTPEGEPGFNRNDTEWLLPLFAPHSILDPVPAPRLDA